MESAKPFRRNGLQPPTHPRKGSGQPPKTPLPGISYVAEPFEWSHNPHIQAKVVQEFQDFLACLFDLLKLLHRLPEAYLKSTTPIPADVLREILGGKGKRLGRIRAFELSLKERTKSLSRSVERLLNKEPKKMSFFLKKPVLPSLATRSKQEDTASDVLRDIEKILGKKPSRPIWHTIIVNNNDPRLKEIGLKNKTDVEMSKGDSVLKQYLQADTLNDRTRSMTKEKLWSMSLDYLKSKHSFPKVEPFKSQFQMAQAYLDGFASLKDHRTYLSILEKHWYKDLLKHALDYNIVLTDDVKTAFRKLGRFYHVSDEAHIGQAESKLCFLVQSLAVWDISRVTMQRAVVFILQKVLALDDGGERLRGWMAARRLPYVVIPPILSTCVPSVMNLGDEATADKEPRQKQVKASGRGSVKGAESTVLKESQSKGKDTRNSIRRSSTKTKL